MSRRGGGGTCALLSVLAVLAVAVTPRAAGAGEVGVPASVAATLENRFATVGAGRCSAAACHGSPQPVFGARTLRNEYATWAERDPHTKAYQVLKSGWSRTITENLRRVGLAKEPAYEDQRCLACHATPGPAADPARAAVVREDGVGCESCHGPAGAWLGVHNSYTWDGLGAHEKRERFGMVETESLAARASACARCHVGEPGREVDHDLIAAGHPRLIFEFSAYLANLPAHWLEKDRNASADFPARAWAIGQAATTRAALVLLRGRALAASMKPRHGELRPWPEFAEYDCASCHHAFRLLPLDPSAKTAETLRGDPAWGTWALPMTEMLASLETVQGAKSFEIALGKLKGTMREASPEPKKVAPESGEVIAALTQWLETLQQEPFDPRRVNHIIGPLRAAYRTPQAMGGRGWDVETQEYLALVPLRQALLGPDRDHAGFLEELRARQTRLKSRFLADRPRPVQSSR